MVVVVHGVEHRKLPASHRTLMASECLEAGQTIRAWHVCVESSGRKPKREYFVHEESEPVCRTALGRHLLALRRYESRGDLIGYQLELRETPRGCLPQRSAKSGSIPAPDW